MNSLDSALLKILDQSLTHQSVFQELSDLTTVSMIKIPGQILDKSQSLLNLERNTTRTQFKLCLTGVSVKDMLLSQRQLDSITKKRTLMFLISDLQKMRLSKLTDLTKTSEDAINSNSWKDSTSSHEHSLKRT